MPWHVEIYVKRWRVFRGFFYHEGVGEDFELVVEDDRGNRHESGSWPTLADANEFAEMVIEDLLNRELGREAKVAPLAEWRERGDVLLVTFDKAEGKFAIVAGNRKSGRVVDTGLWFDTEAEARAALK